MVEDKMQKYITGSIVGLIFLFSIILYFLFSSNLYSHPKDWFLDNCRSDFTMSASGHFTLSPCVNISDEELKRFAIKECLNDSERISMDYCVIRIDNVSKDVYTDKKLCQKHISSCDSSDYCELTMYAWDNYMSDIHIYYGSLNKTSAIPEESEYIYKDIFNFTTRQDVYDYLNTRRTYQHMIEDCD